MNTKLISLAIALMGTAGLAHAQLTTASGAAGFNGSASVTATASSVATATATNNNTAIATVGVGQFDAATGVLVGATLDLNSSRTQNILGSGFKNNGPGRDANGSGNSTAGLTAPGVSSSFSTPITATGSGCSLAMGPTGYITCGWGPVSVASIATNASPSVNAANLNDYVGLSTTNAALSLPDLQATSTLSRTQGQASGSSTTYTVNWSGTAQVSYSYLLHAAPSFSNVAQNSALTLDFGTLALGSSNPSLSFMLYNLTDPNRVGLDLDSFTVTGDAGQFGTNLASFANLTQGGAQSFLAGLDTSSAGSFSAHYILTLSDADVGASSTRSAYQMELNLVGNVAAVPEPETYTMFISGLGLMGVIARRRKRA